MSVLLEHFSHPNNLSQLRVRRQSLKSLECVLDQLCIIGREGCHQIGYGSDIIFTIFVSTPNLRIRIKILTDVKKWYLYLPKSDIGYGSNISGLNADTNRICKNRYG